MSNIRYIFLILFAVLLVDLCAQNEAQISIDNATDSLKLGKDRSAIPILEGILINGALTPKQSAYTQMLLQIAYFNRCSLKFDLLKLENVVNYINCDDPFNIIGFKTLVKVNKNLKDYANSIEWGNKGLKAFKHL